jgi:hypothetical protein
MQKACQGGQHHHYRPHNDTFNTNGLTLATPTLPRGHIFTASISLFDHACEPPVSMLLILFRPMIEFDTSEARRDRMRYFEGFVDDCSLSATPRRAMPTHLHFYRHKTRLLFSRYEHSMCHIFGLRLPRIDRDADIAEARYRRAFHITPITAHVL